MQHAMGATEERGEGDRGEEAVTKAFLLSKRTRM